MSRNSSFVACTCKVCSVEFHVSPERFHRGTGRFCSLECVRQFTGYVGKVKTYKKKSFEYLFRKHVGDKDENGCMLWTGGTTPGGYGVMMTRTPNRKGLPAHRVAWQFAYGEIPEGMQVCHHCDRPACVNPEHLFLGTTQDNTADRDFKGRQARGVKHGRAKLTEEDVRTIRNRYVLEDITYKKLGAEYGIDATVIGCIVRREKWKHLE